MFLLPSINLQLRPTILNMKPGTRIVSNTFTMDDWKPDETATITEQTAPAGARRSCGSCRPRSRARGSSAQGELTLTQQFQKLTGTLGNDSTNTAITGKMLGDQITFNAGGVEYRGRVNGTGMQGTQTSGTAWTATRAAR